MVRMTLGLNVLCGPTALAFTGIVSPAPDGPSPNKPASFGRSAKTFIGKPDLQVRIGNRLQPCVRRLGPEVQARSKGRSHPPLKVTRFLMSRSLEARKSSGL